MSPCPLPLPLATRPPIALAAGFLGARCEAQLGEIVHTNRPLLGKHVSWRNAARPPYLWVWPGKHGGDLSSFAVGAISDPLHEFGTERVFSGKGDCHVLIGLHGAEGNVGIVLGRAEQVVGESRKSPVVCSEGNNIPLQSEGLRANATLSSSLTPRCFSAE